MTKSRSLLGSVAISLAAWGGLPADSHAQLDASCMVSAFNRTAHVQSDGVWVLPNVPANLGQVRVRATCVTDGVVRFGASSLVTVPANGVIKIEDIDFQGPPPVPSSLSLSAPLTALTATGQTVQLSAIATYPGGSMADVTAEETGTDYRTSNPAIATVDADGLVTARASGVALVSAVNEGALGVIRIQVVTSGDTDGDGLPDDWELANGLDPNNPVDALDDQDEDGLSTITEYQAGLNPFSGDSDGDGLKDGREVNDLGTNPLLADTDGDGLRDGLEVQTGSDPLDPDSFNLAAALSSIEVKPSVFRIIFNTVFGEASRQLRVTGRLIDGFSLDITASRYGTTYGSSDFAVAGFGAEDGRVYAGQDGTATVSAGNNGFTATAQATVETFTPRALSYVDLQGYPATGVALSGEYAFVTVGYGGLFVIDISNPLAPFVAASVDTVDFAYDVRISGDFAFIADGDGGLVVVDVSQPLSPRRVASLPISYSLDLVVTGEKAFIADSGGLTIVDVSDPAQPALLGRAFMLARGVDVADGYAVVAGGSAGVSVVDVRDPAHPRRVGAVATHPWGEYAAADVVIRDRLAYVADGGDYRLGGLRVIDFREPSNPVLVGSTFTGLTDRFGLTSTALESGLVFASDYYFRNGVPIFVAGAGNPQYRAVLDFSRAPSFRYDDGEGLTVRDGLVYLAANHEYSGVGTLHIGRYAILEDTGELPPFIALTAPAAGARTSERRRLLLTADARDDVRVASVRFLVDGQPVFTDFDAPYEYSLAVPDGVPSLRIGAVAVDEGGNETSAPEVVVPVDPNSEPVAAFLAPLAGQSVTEGTRIPVAVEATDDHGVVKVELYVNGALWGTDTEAPYLFDFPVPLGAVELAFSTIAYDDVGSSETAGPLAVPVQPDRPPAAEVIVPQDGQEFVEGSLVTIIAGATDDAGILGVELFVDDVSYGVQTFAPYFWEVVVPEVGETARIRVVAEDTRHHQGASVDVVVTAVPDPLTAVHGRAVDEAGNPVAGARVEITNHDVFTLSGVDGTFSFEGLPTHTGPFFLRASAVMNSFELHVVLENGVAPVPGGIAEAGDLVLARDDPGAAVTGRTVDEAGLPVPGATVKAHDDFSVFETTSGPDGRFFLTGVPSGDTLALSATAMVSAIRLRGASEVYAGPDEEVDAGDIFLLAVEDVPDPRTTVIGTVFTNGEFTPEEEPVAGARVNVFTDFDVFSTVTSADGSFSVAGVPTVDGDLRVGAWAEVAGVLHTGRSSFAAPNPGGMTDFETLVVFPVNDGGGEVFLMEPWFLEPRPSSSRIALQTGAPVCGGPASAGPIGFGGL